MRSLKTKVTYNQNEKLTLNINEMIIRRNNKLKPKIKEQKK